MHFTARLIKIYSQNLTMSQTSKINRKSLADMNKEIFEFKKKIQLSEGQRKAHYEELDGEKKRNKDKIKQLKKDIKNLNGQLSTAGQNVDSILTASTKYPKEMGALRNKTGDDIIVILDCKATDLKKKLDQLHHESNKSQRRMKELAAQYHSLLHKKTVHCKKDTGCLEICTLENQIHRVEMNLMEAEHIKKKYRIIQSNLLEDSVAFESTLMKIEEAITTQESEMMHLKTIYGEALGLRDSTRGVLLRQEVSAVNMTRMREKQLEDLRFQVDERRQELERLARRIFPAGRTMMRQESTSSIEGVPSTMDDSTAKITLYLEKAFEKLKAATGETDADDVLKRFLSQKETLSRLSYLRSIAEKEKEELQRRKDILVTELEAFKFAEVKGNEQNAEESEKLKQQIQEEEDRRETLDREVQILRERLCVIGSIVRSFCEKLQDASGTALPMESEDIMETLERQIRSMLDRTEQGVKLDLTVQQVQEEMSGRLKLPVEVTTAAVNRRTSAVLAASETEEEDEVPTRGFLKRQAQIIVDAKSRHKQFPMAGRGRKTLTLK